MRGETVCNGFPLRINVSLLAVVIVSAAIYRVFDNETLGNICLATGWLLTLLAVVPSLFRFVREGMQKGKPRDEDPNNVIPEWKKFCQSMGVKKDIKVKIFPNLRNAYSNPTTIEIGQPILDSLDSLSIKGVFAHELAHIKGKHDLKKLLLFATFLLLGVLYSFYFNFSQLDSSLFWFSVPLLSISFMGIAARFISWPFEYKADLMADQYLKQKYLEQKAVASFLTAGAALRKIEATRDFYSHPSITKRIASLDWSQKTRFKEWYFKL
jgi:Zn-dependent protease with chaperone function